jgi:hypothetical protein
MHTQSQAPDFVHPFICGGAQAFGSLPLEGDRHRQPADAAQHRVRQREQAATSSPLAETARCAAGILETVSTQSLVVPGSPARQAVRRNNNSENNQGFGSAGQPEKERHAAHAATFVCDRIIGSWSRHPDDQPLARTCQLLDNDDLSTRPADALASLTQSARLAPDETTSQVAGSNRRTTKGQLTVAEILKRNAAKFVAAYPSQAAPQVQSTLAKLSLCRTAALGGRKYQCEGCQSTCVIHNSCGDRYCPTCSGARRRDWLESTAELIFDGVDHFQVVFTLPSELSSLSLGNRKSIYNLLFASSWQSLKETIAAEHGYDAAAVMVLHTWNQKLDAHAHVHAVVPGCGPALDGSGIRFAQRNADQASVGRYLVNAESLRTTFRETFLCGLDRLRQRDELKLQGSFAELQSETAWHAFLSELEAVDWVSFIQAPPQPGQSAETVLKYLARYLSGGPISDSRIVSTDNENVTFMARAGEVSGGESKQIPLKLSQLEFTRRWCLHVLPAGFTRTRRYGGWANTRRDQYLELFAKQLDAADVPLADGATDFGPFEEPVDLQTELQPGVTVNQLCKICGCSLIPHSESPKPSWSQVMDSNFRPKWYRLGQP